MVIPPEVDRDEKNRKWEDHQFGSEERETQEIDSGLQTRLTES
jgi:hypothetical protein